MFGNVGLDFHVMLVAMHICIRIFDQFAVINPTKTH